MPGTRCAVAMCNNNLKDSKKAGTGLSFHTFPKDERRKEWILSCKRADKFNPDTSCICSAHFRKEDFETNFQEQLLGTRTKRLLKSTAVPTINILVEDYIPKPSTSAGSTPRKLLLLSQQKDAAHTSDSEEYSGGDDDVTILEISSIAGKRQTTKVIEPPSKRRKTCRKIVLNEEPSEDVVKSSSCISVEEKLGLSGPSDADLSNPLSPCGDDPEWRIETETTPNERINKSYSDCRIELPTNPLPVLVKQGGVKRMMLLQNAPVTEQKCSLEPVLVKHGSTSQLMYLQDIPPEEHASRCTTGAPSSDDQMSCKEYSLVYDRSSSPSSMNDLSKSHPECSASQANASHISSLEFASPDKALIYRLRERVEELEEKVKVQGELYKKQLRAVNLKHRLKVIQLNERIHKLQGHLQEVPDIVRKETPDASKAQQDPTKRRAISNEVWRLLSGTFTDNEISAICDKGRQKIRWKESELLKAHTLRTLSYGAYVFVKKQLKYPLPSLKYLTRWLRIVENKAEDDEIVEEEVIDEDDLNDSDEEICIENIDRDEDTISDGN